MKLFIDCEFNGYQGALISMALVPEMGEPFYHVLNTDGMKIVPWVRENVMDRLIFNHRGGYPVSKSSFQAALQKYLFQWGEVTIIADWPDDIKYFCDSLITGPGEMMNTPFLNFEIRRLNINSELPHNALSDAYAIRQAFNDAGFGATPTAVQVVQMLDKREEEIKRLTAERDIAIGMLAEWVNAVENNGTGWDDWDEHYKDAAYRDNPIRQLLNIAINKGKEK
jgi:hypothetical protein